MKKAFIHALCRTFWRFAVGAVLLLLATVPGQAETNTAPRILFLQLQLKNGAVTLVKSSVHAGYFKPQSTPEDNSAIHFELLSAGGETLWTGAVSDPTLRAIEYEDPPHSGQLKRKDFHLAQAEFTVRVPLLVEAKRVQFYKQEIASPGAQATRKPLGSVPFPPDSAP